MAAKRKRGQPTKYRPEFCERVVELSKEGRSVATIATMLGVCRDTIYEWMSAHRAFSDAMTHARDASLSWWEEKAREGIVTQDGVSINAALWGKVMSARFPDDYREKREVELSGKVGWEQFMDEADAGDEVRDS